MYEKKQKQNNPSNSLTVLFMVRRIRYLSNIIFIFSIVSAMLSTMLSSCRYLIKVFHVTKPSNEPRFSVSKRTFLLHCCSEEPDSSTLKQLSGLQIVSKKGFIQLISKIFVNFVNTRKPMLIRSNFIKYFHPTFVCVSTLETRVRTAYTV